MVKLGGDIPIKKKIFSINRQCGYLLYYETDTKTQETINTDMMTVQYITYLALFGKTN